MDKLFCPASWIILAAVMIIIEIITLGLSSIWFAAGAIGSAITAAFDGPEWLQVVVFMAEVFCASAFLYQFLVVVGIIDKLPQHFFFFSHICLFLKREVVY